MMMKLAQLPLRERIGLLLAIGFMVLMIADAFVLKPTFRHLRGLDSAIAAEESELRRSKEVLQYEHSVQQQYMEVKDLLGVSGPESETIEAFKNELDELALSYGVQIRSMRHLAPERSDHLVTYVIEVGAYETEAPNLLRFLHAINTAPGLMRVRQLTVSSQSPDLQVSGTLSVTRAMTLMPRAGEE